MYAQVEELKQSSSQIAMDLERERQNNETLKSSNVKLTMDLSNANKTIKKLEKSQAELIEYMDKFEDHYKRKKKQFEDEFKRLSENNEELKTKVMQLKIRNRQDIEELNFAKEKIKTTNCENQLLKNQIEDIKRTINAMPIMENTSMHDSNFMSFAKLKNIASSTPKPKFIDDSLVKYTSPGLRTRDVLREFNRPEQDYLSRRFSVESFSRGSSASSNIGMMPGLNRFKTISENEFEEPRVNQKFLKDNFAVASKLASTLQARYRQVKPDLKSSYPLEILPLREQG